MGTVIGSGIFLVPATVLRETGGAVGPAMLVWLVGGALSLLGALTYAELGAMHPDAGGMYRYVRDAFGALPAFLVGWTFFFVIATGAVATLAVAFSGYLREFLPLSPPAAKLVSALMILTVMAVNVCGARQGADVQNWSTALKAGAIVLMSVLFLAVGEGLGSAAEEWPAAVTPSLLSGMGLAMIGVLWAYEGWQYVTFSSGEMREPARDFAGGLIAGTAAVVVIYLLANLAYVAALGAGGVSGSDRVASQAVGAVLGPGAAKAVAAVILVSMFSAANGVTLTAPRMYYAMARDGVFFRKLAEVSPAYGTPAFAIVAGSLWSVLLAATGTFEQLLTYVVFTEWAFLSVAALAVFVFRRREPDAPRPFRVPGYPITPAVFVLSAAAIVVNTLVAQPLQALLGLGLVLLGIPAYFWWRARGAP
jgi:APA family basic amino acid/polyamine antiporter